MTTIVQKADLAGLDFTNNNTNAAGGIGVNVSPTSSVGTALAGVVSNLALPTGAAGVGFTDGSGAATTVSALSTTQTVRNNKVTATVMGEVPGVKIGVCTGAEAGWLQNPAAGDFVALYPYITTSPVRNRVWAMNPIVDIVSGSPATAWCYEGNINVQTANTPDPRSTNHALGADMVSGGTFAPSAAFATFSSTLANRWKHGLWFDNIGGQTGSSLIKTAVNVNVDYGLDISSATVNVMGVKVGAVANGQVGGIGVRQFANSQVGLFLQRFTDTAPAGNMFQLVNANNSAVLAYIDAVGSIGTANINPIGGLLSVNGDLNVVGNSTATGIHQSQAFRATGSAPTAGVGQISYGAVTSLTVGLAGAASAPPITPLGYININVAGVSAKLAYYAP
jgi:hypothetical protein